MRLPKTIKCAEPHRDSKIQKKRSAVRCYIVKALKIPEGVPKYLEYSMVRVGQFVQSVFGYKYQLPKYDELQDKLPAVVIIRAARTKIVLAVFLFLRL